jgi:hypothetical protein
MTVAKAAAGVALAVLSCGLADPALGVTWNSETTPLNAYEDGVAQAQAYGNFHNYESESAHSNSSQRDPRPGGDSVYVETAFWWYSQSYHCSQAQPVCFWNDTMKQTDRTNAATWAARFRARNLRSDADRARGDIKTCEDQAWSPDPCSAHKIATFTY